MTSNHVLLILACKKTFRILFRFRMTLRMILRMILRMTLSMTFKTWYFRGGIYRRVHQGVFKGSR